MSMTGQDVVDDLRSEILEPSPTFFSNSRMLKLINLAQNEFVRLTRVLQSFAYTSSVQGQADYPLPSDWLGSEKVFFNAQALGGTANWRPLEPTTIEKIGQESPNFLSNDPSTYGTPRKYYLVGTTMYLFPRPVASGTSDIFLFYEAKAKQLTTLNDALSVDDSLYAGVRAHVLAKLWAQDNEDAKHDKQMLVFKEELGNGRKWKNKRILDGRWKMDIPSFVPFSYTGNASGSAGGQINPLNM